MIRPIGVHGAQGSEEDLDSGAEVPPEHPFIAVLYALVSAQPCHCLPSIYRSTVQHVHAPALVMYQQYCTIRTYQHLSARVKEAQPSWPALLLLLALGAICQQEQQAVVLTTCSPWQEAPKASARSL